MSEVKINRETAIQEFESWAKAWRIGRKMRHANAKDKEEFEEKKLQVIDMIEDGFLLFNSEDSSISYSFQFPTLARDLKEIKLNRPQGNALVEGDKYEEKQSVHKAQAFLCQMTGKDMAFFAGLDYVDLESLYTVMNLFLGS